MVSVARCKPSAGDACGVCTASGDGGDGGWGDDVDSGGGGGVGTRRADSGESSIATSTWTRSRSGATAELCRRHLGGVALAENEATADAARAELAPAARKLRDCGAAGCKKLAAAVGGGGGAAAAAAKPAAKRPKKAA